MIESEIEQKTQPEQFPIKLEEEKAYNMAEKIKGLSDKNRLRIISFLSTYEGLANVNEITNAMPLSQPTVSHHLKILRTSGIVRFERKGLFSYYYLNRQFFEDISELVNYALK